MPKGIYPHKKEWHHTEETKKKIGFTNSIVLKGRKLSEKTKIKIGNAVRGREVLSETRKKLSEIQKGRHNSLQTEFKKGHRVSEEQRIEIRKKLLGRNMGAKSPNWKGGLSFEPYSVDWTKTLKRAIKERDHYLCGICKSQDDLVVHHKDCNKKNCSPENLITLCRKCHSKIHKNQLQEDLDKLKESEKTYGN